LEGKEREVKRVRTVSVCIVLDFKRREQTVKKKLRSERTQEGRLRTREEGLLTMTSRLLGKVIHDTGMDKKESSSV